MRSTDGGTASATVTTAVNMSLNADLPVIDISSKLMQVDRDVTGFMTLTSDVGNSLVQALDNVHDAYVTLTSSHLDQWRHSCQPTPHDVIRSVINDAFLNGNCYGRFLLHTEQLN